MILIKIRPEAANLFLNATHANDNFTLRANSKDGGGETVLPYCGPSPD